MADASDGTEGGSPVNPADWSLRRAAGVQRIDTLTLSEVVIAILDCRRSFPRATSAALVRERAGPDEVIHLVLLDAEREPLASETGAVPAVTYAARQLDKDLLAAFGDKEVIVLT